MEDVQYHPQLSGKRVNEIFQGIISLRQAQYVSIMDAATKAFLISVGTVELEQPTIANQVSTAGPGAGGQSIFFRSGDRLARMSVVAGSPLCLARHAEGCTIMMGENEIARGEGRCLKSFADALYRVALREVLRSGEWFPNALKP